MESNSTCMVVHLGKINHGKAYIVNGKVLESVEEQKRQGVQLHSSLNETTLVERIVNKPFGMLAFIA